MEKTSRWLAVILLLPIMYRRIVPKLTIRNYTFLTLVPDSESINVFGALQERILRGFSNTIEIPRYRGGLTAD